MKRLALLAASMAYLHGQGLDPKALLEPPTSAWPTYNGDYTGRRYSTLSRIDQGNVGSLTLAWAFQTHAAALKATPLEVNGILYFSVPDHVWAVDARTGRQIWHYTRPSPGDHVGHRGVAMYNNRLYFGTPDAHLVCLDARNGEKLWEVEVGDVKFGYYISAPPLVVKHELIVGISDDQTDVPGFLEARDPADGKLLWHWSSLPKPGEPGSETWPNAEAMAHGGGTTWVQGTYDPEFNLIYWGTGNPHPVEAGIARPGANLYTCSLVALDADTGKMKWFIQTSPHDTHDRDSNQTPVLFDAEFQGKPRKLLALASRSGYYFLLDRATGESLVTVEYGGQNWSNGVDRRGQPIPKPEQDQTRDGVFFEGSATNWWAPSFDPQTGLFYVNAGHSFSVGYLNVSGEDNKVDDHQGADNTELWGETMLLALDYRTGKPRWKRVSSRGSLRGAGEGGEGNGILTTAGHLLFTNESDRLVALDPATGKVLWRVYAGGNLTGCPMTYELDGRQYVLTPVDGVLYAWSLPETQ
jgi:alcohol dehydrogenase (cytochrome c)